MQDSSKVFGFYFLTLNGGGFSSDDWKNPSDSAENFSNHWKLSPLRCPAFAEPSSPKARFA
jgi:hypothetical protein